MITFWSRNWATSYTNDYFNRSILLVAFLSPNFHHENGGYNIATRALLASRLRSVKCFFRTGL